ncbi:MAG: Spy/CpxP family protein refolding chaperone [Reyranella sp.]|uniref:Spy/CpxP family protein refolding chaperone n=1 Tax=Reyranella sp. TaxID=1929291 RepID=UPI003D09A914
MTRWILVATAALLLAPLAAGSQQSPQPYAGQEKRPLKALSAQQIADLEAGRGMGLALAAELNGYPGPLHVLEFAEPLGLTPAQRERTQVLLESMKEEARALGARVLAAEGALDRQFASRSVTEASLREGVRDVAALQGDLRATHLKYHLAVAELLTPQQIARYATLRGYGQAAPATPHHGRH